MNGEFDDKLKSRITKVFDNYEDDSAQQGWLLLRERFPEKKEERPIAWLWWGSVAAVLLLVLGVGLILYTGNSGKKINEQLQTKVNHTSNTDTLNPVKVPAGNNSTDKAILTNNQSIAATTTDKKIQNHTETSKIIAHPKPNHTLRDEFLLTAKTTKHHRQSKREVLHEKNTGTTESEYAVTSSKSSAKQTLNGAGKASAENEASTSDTSKTAQNILANSTAKPDTIPKLKPRVKEPRKNMFANTIPQNKPDQKPLDKKVKFGIYAATYFNYAKGSDNEFNVGAGVLSEIRIAWNLKLVTGIGLSQNSLNYKSDIPQSANTYLYASLSGHNNLIAGASTGGIASASTAIPVVQNYQASLIGLDIPVNLKYQFNQSDTYISAGVSSGTYVNETYQYVYSYAPTFNTNTATQSQNNKTQSSFGTFDLARTLNVSFGMGYPLGKTNRLIVEPFLKYPLDGLGSQQIKFGAGGINLKFNFLSTKK